MNRTLRYERKFPIEQYGNNAFVDEITGLPEDVFLNAELMAKIRYLQMVEVELAYRTYVELYKQSKTVAVESLARAVEFLESEKNTTMAFIEATLKPKKE